MKIEEVAWHVVNENRELFESMTKEHAVKIITQVLRDQIEKDATIAETCGPGNEWAAKKIREQK